MKSAEQQARDVLERLGIEGAQAFTAGDLVELANLIAGRQADARDAARYRHMRSADGLSDAIMSALDLGHGVLLDEAIDAEMRQAKH